MYIVVTLRNRRGNLRRWCESIKNSFGPFTPVIVDYNSINPLDGSEDYLPDRSIIINAKGDPGIDYPEATLKNIGISMAKEPYSTIGCTNIDIVYQDRFWDEIYAMVDRCGGLVQAIRMDAPKGSTVTPNGEVFNAEGVSLICQPSSQGVALAYGDCQAMLKADWDAVRGYNELMTGWGILDNDLSSRCLQHGLGVHVMGYKHNPTHIHGWHEEPPIEYRSRCNDRNMKIAMESYINSQWYDMWDYGTGKTQGIEWEVVRD